MIDQTHFHRIKEIHGHYASWAVWANVGATAKSNIDDLSVFDVGNRPSILNELNPEVIMVGLNISRPIELPFGNFHDGKSVSQDYKIRHAVKGSPLWGAYMTDVVKDFEHKMAGKVMQYLRHNPLIELQNVESLKKEINDIGAKDPLIIAFGNDSYAVLERNLRRDYRIVKVPHYSMAIGPESYREQLRGLVTR